MNRRSHQSASELKRKQQRRKQKLLRQRIIAVALTAFAGALIFFLIQAFDQGEGPVSGPGTTGQARASATPKVSDAPVVVKNVFVDGVDISGMSRSQAKAAVLEKNAERIGGMKLTVTNGTDQWAIAPEDIGASVNVDKALDEAMTIGRTGTSAEQREAARKLESQPYQGTTKLTFDKKLLETSLNGIKKQLDDPAQSAGVEFTPRAKNPFNFTPEAPGREFDLDDAMQKAEELLNAGHGGVVPAVIKSVAPATRVADLEKATSEIITVTTSLKNSTENRTFNIQRALAHFDGLIVQPGEEVSFNDIVGPRTEENGYRTAKVILNDDFVDGPGGGVCQVSTTLYHAAVRSGLEIVKRSKHTLKVAYVPLGQDATVDYGTKDFIFKNNTELPVFFECQADEKNVTITVFGRPIPGGENIKIVTEILEETPAPPPEIIVIDDPNNTIIPKGKNSIEKPASREGYKVKTWRVFMKEGKEVRRVGLYTDTYKTVTGTLYSRTELPAVPPVTPKPAQ